MVCGLAGPHGGSVQALVSQRAALQRGLVSAPALTPPPPGSHLAQLVRVPGVKARAAATWHPAKVHPSLSICHPVGQHNCLSVCVFLPVNGNWASWSPFPPCPVTCGVALVTSSRTCTNPAPSHGGQSCEGSAKRTEICDTKVPCPGEKVTAPPALILRMLFLTHLLL